MRKHLFTLPLLGLLVFPVAVAAQVRPWLNSVDEAFAAANEKNQLILVDLYADWCGWCKRLEEEVFSTATFQEFAKDFVLLRVDTEDGGEGSRLQQKYEAYSLPTTLVLDHREIMIAEVRGFAPAEQYVPTIAREIAGFDELVEGYDRFGQSSDLRVLGVLADEFHKRNDGARAAALYRRMLVTEELTSAKEDLIRYQLTDALRLAGRYEEAVEVLQKVRGNAAKAQNQGLVERLDLLLAQIALDKGDCQTAQSSLENFLSAYPESDLIRVARQTLATLKAEGFQCS